MTERFFIDNRRKLAARLEEGSAAVLFAGKAPLKRGDEYLSLIHIFPLAAVDFPQSNLPLAL